MLTSAVAQVTTPELFSSQQFGPPVTVIKFTLRSLRILSSVKRMGPILKVPITRLMLCTFGAPETMDSPSSLAPESTEVLPTPLYPNL
jgi:hypothetical protein